MCYIYNGEGSMDEQLFMNDFFKDSECNKSEISLYDIYYMFKNKFKELNDLSILIDKLYDELSPITCDLEFRHNLLYDNRDRVFRYQGSVLRINNIDIFLSRDNNILFNVYNTDIKVLNIISSFVNDNRDTIRYILSTYRKYYSLFTYKDGKLGNTLGTYYFDDNTYIVVYANGSVRLFNNYYDISNEDISKYMMVNVEDIVDGYCRKLMLSKD